MDCAQEVSLLRARLSRERGVRDLQFDTFQGRMTVQYDSGVASPASIESAVRDAGMRCEPWREAPAVSGSASSWWRHPGLWPWLSGLALAVALVVHVAVTGELVETLLAHGHSAGSSHDHHFPPLALTFYSIAIAAGMARIVPKTWTALRLRRLDMNVLVTASVAGAVVLGEWVEAATLCFLFTLAGRLESWSIERARDAVAGFLRVTPPRAHVLHGDHEHEVQVERVPLDSQVHIAPGARIPFDGVVLSGSSWVNQALITGESVAVEKGAGDTVYAGSLNEDAELVIRTTKLASDTVLARMIRMIDSSQARRARGEQMIETFALRYTPFVLALALAVAVGGPLLRGGAWDAWAYSGMMVLLAACPCALVISTPVTAMAALTSAAKTGVLFKGSAFLEEAARLRVVAAPDGDAPPGLRLERIPANATAEERLALVERLQRSEPYMAYVGGGAEDAEALTRAAVGISPAGASDTASEAADVVLLHGGAENIRFLVSHARRAVRIVGANITIALAMKLLFVAAALTGRATLWMAVAADMGATLLVTLNGLRMLGPAKMKV